MNDATKVDSPRKPRIWLWIAAAAVLGMLMLAVGLGTWSARQNAQAARQLAEVAESGEPMSAAELELFYAYPPKAKDMTQLWLDGCGPLAAPEFAAAAKGLPLVGVNEDEIPPPGQPWDKLAAAEQLLSQYQSSLALLHQAAAGGGAARFPTSFKNGSAMLLPHADGLSVASRLLILEAQVRAHRGDAKGAARSLDTALAIGGSLENEPILVSQFVRMACDDRARDNLLNLLQHLDFADEDLIRLQDTLSKIDYQSGLQRGLMGERALCSILLNDPRQLGQIAGAKMPPGIDFAWPLLRGSTQRLYFDFMQRALAASRRPLPQALAEAKQIEAEFNANTKDATIIGQLKYTMTGLVATSLTSSFTRVCRYTADNDVAMTAIAVERYRRQYGKLPAHLSELVPQFLPSVPIDLFDGRPLKYVPSDGEYLIYHVGEDGIDNGGQGADTGRHEGMLRIKYPTAKSDSQPVDEDRRTEANDRRNTE